LVRNLSGVLSPRVLTAAARGLPARFERMEIDKITAEDPDSLSYYNSVKAVQSRKNRPAQRSRR
jgi:hypothetical protein